MSFCAKRRIYAFGGQRRNADSSASPRMTEHLDFQITNYKLPITNESGGAVSRLPLSLHPAGLVPAGNWPPTTSLCRFADALRLFAFQRLRAALLFTGNVYLDLLRLGFSFLGQLHLQYALVIVGLDVLMVNSRGQSEGAGEAAILPLHSPIVLFFLFLLELALPMHGQRVVLDPDVDVLLVDPRHLNLQCDVVLVFVDVHGRSECGRGQRFILPFRPTRIAEQTVHTVLQRNELTKRIPPGNHGHNLNPPSNSIGNCQSPRTVISVG